MSEQTHLLIPTNYKVKIPHTHSWPLAAKEISEGLRSCPQYEKLSLVFSGVRSFWPWSEQKLLEAAHSISLQDELSDADGKDNDELVHQCTLYIHPVQREHRTVIHDNLTARLPLLADWLTIQSKRRVLDRTSLKIVWEHEPNKIVVRKANSNETERIRR
jgi:hypothetical protein